MTERHVVSEEIFHELPPDRVNCQQNTIQQPKHQTNNISHFL